MSTNTRSISVSGLARLRLRLALVIEASWLAGFVLVPLVFRGRELVAIYSQPKYFLLHLIALIIVVAWTAEWALGRSDDRPMRGVFDRIDNWVGREPGRWAVLAFGGFALAAIASTLLSPLPLVSVWGRDFEDLGYELYSTLSFLVVLFAIALRLRTRGQLFRLAIAVAAPATVTALYGLAQHFGWDPVGRGADLPRVISSMGNALFFGSYLVMAVTITVALGLYGQIEGRRWALPLAALAVGVQLAVLWFAGGRGPWLGTTVSVIAFISMGWVWLARRILFQAIAVIGAGVLMAFILVAVPADAGHGERGFRDILEAPGEFIDAAGFALTSEDQDTGPSLSIEPTASAIGATPIPGETAVPGVEPTAPAIGATPIPVETVVPGIEPSTPATESLTVVDGRSKALSGRAKIWRNSIKLIGSRDVPFGESGVLRSFRFLFGFGPDMYFYSYPIAAESQAQLTSVSHAHNYLLQVLMEEGLVGALSMLAAATFLLLAAWRVLRARNIEPWLAVIMLGVLAALAGRAADQLGSVGRITDLMLFFALSGTLIAITEIARTGHPTDNEPMNHPSRRERRRQTSSQLRIPALALTAVVAFAAIWLFLAKDVSMMRAGWTAANGFEHSAASEGDPAFLAFNRAVELAPDVERYALEQAKLLRRTAAAAEDPEDEVRLLLLAYEILARYEDRDPYAWVTQRTLATITLRLVTLGDTSRIPEAIARYNVVTELMSAYPSILAEAAAASVELGDMQQALAYSDLAIAGEPSTTILPQAWWARGSALIDGNRVEEAVEAFNTAIERRPRGNYAQLSHLELATILEAAGDEAGATTQRRKAADIY